VTGRDVSAMLTIMLILSRIRPEDAGPHSRGTTLHNELAASTEPSSFVSSSINKTRIIALREQGSASNVTPKNCLGTKKGSVTVPFQTDSHSSLNAEAKHLSLSSMETVLVM